MSVWLPTGNEFDTSLSIFWWTYVHVAKVSITTGMSTSSPKKSWSVSDLQQLSSSLTLVEIPVCSTSTCQECAHKKADEEWAFILEDVNLTSFARAEIPFSDGEVLWKCLFQVSKCCIIADDSCAISLYIVSILLACSILEVTWKTPFLGCSIAEDILDGWKCWKYVNCQLCCVVTIQPCASQGL